MFSYEINTKLEKFTKKSILTILLNVTFLAMQNSLTKTLPTNHCGCFSAKNIFCTLSEGEFLTSGECDIGPMSSLFSRDEAAAIAEMFVGLLCDMGMPVEKVDCTEMSLGFANWSSETCEFSIAALSGESERGLVASWDALMELFFKKRRILINFGFPLLYTILTQAKKGQFFNSFSDLFSLKENIFCSCHEIFRWSFYKDYIIIILYNKCLSPVLCICMHDALLRILRIWRFSKNSLLNFILFFE